MSGHQQTPTPRNQPLWRICCLACAEAFDAPALPHDRRCRRCRGFLGAERVADWEWKYGA